MGAPSIDRAKVCASLVLLGSACSDDVDKPPPPDMRSVIHEYAMPTASLTADNIDDVQTALQNQIEILKDVCGWGDDAVNTLCSNNVCGLCSALVPLTDTFEAIASGDDGADDLQDRVRGLDGFMNLVRICEGSGPEPTIDEANGTIVLTIGFTGRGIDPVFGGDATDCQFRVDDQAFTLNGTIDLAFQRPFFPEQLLRLQPIVRVIGTLQEGSNAPQALATSVQLSAAGGANLAFTFDLPGDQGNMVFFTGTNATGIHAANGRFSCSLTEPNRDQLTCTQVTTGETIP